ncbi:hypothetical protein LB505_008109 [Fusarium chuoi]|nr:hypothetical protein LB505_008109 [Fusarium chuoi]
MVLLKSSVPMPTPSTTRFPAKLATDHATLPPLLHAQRAAVAPTDGPSAIINHGTYELASVTPRLPSSSTPRVSLISSTPSLSSTLFPSRLLPPTTMM